MRFIIGFILGVIVGQVGFQGIARIMDKGITQIQNQAKELGK